MQLLEGKLSYLSEGAKYRLFLNSIPSILFIFFYNKFRNVAYSKFWLLISIINILLFILVVTRTELSGFADRIGLYFLPIQILVFANLEYIINHHTNKEEGVRNLKRCLETILSKINIYQLSNAENKKIKFNFKIDNFKIPLEITNELIQNLLNMKKNDGPPEHMYM